MATDYSAIARQFGGTPAEETDANGAMPSDAQVDYAAMAQQFGGVPEIVEPTESLPPSSQILKQVPEGQVVAINGLETFQGPNFATSDPRFVEDIKRGATFDQAVMNARNRELISALPGGSAAATFMQGAPLLGQYMDEILGGIYGMKSSQRAQQAAVERTRRMQEALASERPGVSTALQVAGGIASAVPLGAAAGVGRLAPLLGATVPTQVARGGLAGAVGGALEGAISGYGAGTTPETRATEALSGGAVGGIAGGVLGAAAPAVSANIRNAFNRLRGSDVSTIAREFNISRDAAIAVRDALAFEDFSTAQKVLRDAGSQSMLADISPGAQSILDAAMTASPEAMNLARRSIQDRTTKAARDVGEKLDERLGEPVDIVDMQRSIKQETMQERESLYSAAYSRPIDYSSPEGMRLEELSQRVATAYPSALREANQLMQGEGYQSQQLLGIIDQNGKVTIERLPDVRQLDLISRQLNEMSSKAQRAGDNNQARVVGNLSKEIRDILKGINPDYKSALAAGENTIKRVNAAQFGFDLLGKNVSRGEVARFMRDSVKTPEQKEMIARGLRSNIDERLAKIAETAGSPDTDPAELNQIMKAMTSEQERSKVAAVLGKDAADDLYKQIDESLYALRMRSALALNSKTAMRQATIQRIEGQQYGLLDALRKAEPIEFSKMLFKAFTGATEEAEAIRKSGLWTEAAQVLTQIRGQNAQDALAIVNRAISGQPVTDSQARLVSRVLTIPAAVGVYTAVTQEQQ
jgi:hypothetical protein